MADREKIIDRIRKAIARAEDQAGLPEGEVAARIAQQLMAEHAIAEAELTIVTDPMEERDIDLGQRAQWRRMLAASVARHCQCWFAYTSGERAGTLYGRQSDLEVADYLYSIILHQIEAEAERHMEELARKLGVRYLSISPGAKREQRNSFRQGAMLAVVRRLREMRDEQRKVDPRGTALLSLRNDEAENWARERHNFRSGGSSQVRYSEEGYKAGMRISLAAGVTEGGGRQVRQLTGRRSGES